MATIIANHITIEYEQWGDVENDTVILMRGLGTQLIDWPDALIKGLVDMGFHVVTFDNRDVGLSQKFDDRPEYDLKDMAADVIGLMDSLEIGTAHIFGISMGGMIAQVMGVYYSDRLDSLISVMSSSGNPDLPRATKAAMDSLYETPDPDGGAEAVIALTAKGMEICGSPGYPESLEERIFAAKRRYDRCYLPGGVARQMNAVIKYGDRTEELKTINVRTLIIHGADDPLIPLAAGEHCAACIPGSILEIVGGMGHNIPVSLVPEILNILGKFLQGKQS